MGLVDILKQLDFAHMDDEEKAALAKVLQKHQRDLRTALNAVERGLQQLALAPGAPPARPASPARGRKRKQKR
jgi:hypothetical protein